MSFIERELDRITKALHERHEEDDIYRQLYAAQQALSWALEPEGVKAPYSTIMGTPEATADCPSSSYRDPS